MHFCREDLFLSLQKVQALRKCHFMWHFHRVCTVSAGPEEMPLYVAFPQGLHCLPKYLFGGMKRVNKTQCEVSINHVLMGLVATKLVFGVSYKVASNQSPQLQRLARKLKFRL